MEKFIRLEGLIWKSSEPNRDDLVNASHWKPSRIISELDVLPVTVKRFFIDDSEDVGSIEHSIAWYKASSMLIYDVCTAIQH